MVLALLATLSAGLFCGAALYVSFVEHPARMECGTELALTEFAPSYRRATKMQVPLALVGFLASSLTWWRTSQIEWLIGGILVVAVVPFTLVFILPINHKLLNPALEKSSREAEYLLKRWARLHFVRSALSFMAFIIFLMILASNAASKLP